MVDLAQGSVELYATPCGTLVSLEEVEAIVAVGPLICLLGCRLQWGETECLLYHPKKGRIKLMIDSRVSEALALEFISKIERYRMETVGAAVRAIQAHEMGSLPSSKQAITALTEAILTGNEVPVKMGEAVLALRPSTPKGILQDFTNWAKVDSESLWCIAAGNEGQWIRRANSCFICVLGTRARRMSGLANRMATRSSQ